MMLFGVAAVLGQAKIGPTNGEAALDVLVIQKLDDLRKTSTENYDGAHILAVDRPAKDVVRLVGTVASIEQAKTLRQDLKKYFDEEVEHPAIGSVAVVQIDGLLVHDPQDKRNLTKIRLIEELMPKLLANSSDTKTKILSFDPSQKRLAVCGVVSAIEERDLFKTAFSRLDWLESVDCSQVFVMDDITLESSLSMLANDAYRMLRVDDGRGLLRVTEKMIRGGRIDPSVWYLRAAGFLLEGDRRAAIGAVRLAEYHPLRYRIFELWQRVPLRREMEMMIDQRTLLLLPDGD